MNDKQNIQEDASLRLDEERRRRRQRRRSRQERRNNIRRKIKSWALIVLFYFVVLVLLSGLLEFIEYRFGFCLWNYLPKKTALFAALLPLLSKIITTALHPGKGISAFRPDGVGFKTHAKQWLAQTIKRYIVRNTPLLIALLLAFTLAVPAYAAKERWVTTLAHWLVTPQDKDSGGTSAPPPPDEGTGSPEPAAPQGGEASGDDASGAAEDPGDSSPRLIDPETLLLNTEEPEALTEEEYAEVFFMADPYQIHDWESEEEVKAVIGRFVQDKLSIQSPPNYGMTGIPQSVQDSIAEASVMEGSTTTASALMEVIYIRENAYGKSADGENEKNTSYLLARLLRENFGVFGDAYRLQNASKEASFAQYGRSIIWGFKTLNYSIPAESYYNNLKIIAERYEKQTMAVSANDPEFRYAGQLRDAFEAEAEQFLAAHGQD